MSRSDPPSTEIIRQRILAWWETWTPEQRVAYMTNPITHAIYQLMARDPSLSEETARELLIKQGSLSSEAAP